MPKKKKKPSSKKKKPAQKKTSRAPKKSKASPEVDTSFEEKDYWDKLMSLKQRSQPQPKLVPVKPVGIKDQKRKLFLIVALIMVFIFVGWLWSLKYSLKLQPGTADLATQQEWQKVKDELDQSLATIREGLASLSASWSGEEAELDLEAEELAKLKQNLVEEATKDWITYNNFDYNFSIKYPPDWRIEEAEQQFGVKAINIFNDDKDYTVEESSLAPISLTYTADVYDNSIDKYITDDKIRAFIKGEKVIIAGQEAYIIQGGGEGVYHDYRVLFAQGNVFRFISNAHLIGTANFSATEGEIDEQEISGVFNQILLTFKFIAME